LLRHAKSSWADPGEPDHDRPLNERGRESARQIGAVLRRDGLIPDLVLCSSARRTCETAALLDLPDTTTLEIDHDLYVTSPDVVLALMAKTPDAVETLMVVGHNPTTQTVALALAGSDTDGEIARMRSKY